MRRFIVISAFAISFAAAIESQNAPATLRLDYFHRGGPGGERIEFDSLNVEGPWAGSLTQLADPTGLGKYLFEVVDRDSGRLLYSRGFASIYGEWETTPEFRKANRYFHESIRFPRPVAPARVIVKKRNASHSFDELWSSEFDPRSLPSTGKEGLRPAALLDNGPPNQKVDVLLMSEGYSAAELGAFQRHANNLIAALFNREPFRTRRSDFNVWTLNLPGRQLGVAFNVLGLDRYVLTEENRTLRTLAAAAPYDLVVILVNETRYGGGGIFNQQSAVAAGNEYADYVFIHELAHNLAGLADEYVGSVPYETGAPTKAEPWEPNVTALHDPAQLKWRDLVEPSTPLPTPLSYAGKVGAYEGAAYESRGLYRPEAECIMGVRKVIDFCRVCQRALQRAIDLHTR